jgi:protein tyrosine/serine phosphatase
MCLSPQFSQEELSIMRKRLGALLASCLTLALLLSPTLAQNEPRYKELPNFHRVNDQLYRGAQPKTNGHETLAKLGIKTIINLRDNDERERLEAQKARAAGFNYFNFPVGKLGRPSNAEIQKIMAIINLPENQPVFVHCKYGADRTGVVIGAFRILHEGWTSERAKAEANRYGMKIWQFAMKDYLHDLYRDQKATAESKNSASP